MLANDQPLAERHRDLAALQRRALEEGIPYQTLIAGVLHKYVSGGLRDIVPLKERARNK